MSEVDKVSGDSILVGAADTIREQLTSMCEIIRKSARLASQTGDFSSFSSVLDVSLGMPSRFCADEAAVILGALYQVLSESPSIAYEIGWDMLELLLKYVDHFSAGVENRTTQRPFRVTMALFSLLCEQGNHGELLMRGCELMQHIESERNVERLAALTLDDNALDTAVVKESVDVNPGFDIGSTTRHEDIKFCVLFEVVRFSLLNIKTAHPSAYLLEAAATLLQVADDPNADLLSVSTYGRRMYLLARDFAVADADAVTEEEMHRVRCILVNFVSHAADVLLRRYSLKWAERLYVQMRYKVALAPPLERQRVYSETEYTRRMSEVMARMSQLLMSYDIDPEACIHEAIGLVMNGSGLAEVPPRLPPTEVDGVDILSRNKWTDALRKGVSLVGISAMKTQIHFDSQRRQCESVRFNMLFTLQVSQRLAHYASSKDIMLYWSLWCSLFFRPDTMRVVGEKLLNDYLNVLLSCISDSNCNEQQFVMGSIFARALRFQTSDFAYNYCINVMKTSDSPAEQFVVVETLKSLATGKICTSEDSCVSAQSHVQLTPDRRREIAEVSRDSIQRLCTKTNRFPCYYINLLSVVPTDRQIVLQICDQAEKKCTMCRSIAAQNDACTMQIDILTRGLTQLREFANTF